MTLKGECCFYTDQSGIVKESSAKVRENLAKREREYTAEQNWFESCFDVSPWFTTLISALIGPWLILLLMLTLGPCILNRLVAFIRKRLGAIQLMVMRAQHQALYPIPEVGEPMLQEAP